MLRPLSPPARALLLFLVASLALRLVAIFATGFCDDEAYVVTISRAPALSYFDHPPLHQWALWAWTALFGEGRAARLPFLGFDILANIALFGLTRRLYSAAAAGWALFVFDASGYFLLHPDGYILPDPPLFAGLALGVWAVAEILVAPRGRETRLWLAAGLAFGLAGLAKYSAAFAPLGLSGFLLTDAKGRRRLADPRPFLGAALGLVCLAPALIWNARHGWVSFAFQSSRAARHLVFDARAAREIAESLGAQIASMTPWMMPPLLGGLWRALSRRGEAERLLLWLSLPPLAFFALLPLFGQRPIGHWFNSGWLFAFPLAGAWLAERTPRFRSRFAVVAATLSLACLALYLAAVDFGLPPLGKMRDPTRDMFDYPAAPLRAAYARAGARFVLVDSWRLGGRLGVALGPDVPICAMGPDPRGFAFACDASKHLGETALIVHMSEKAHAADAAPFFRSVEPLAPVVVGRRGAAEFSLEMEAGRDLLRAPPLPYGP